jgi:hypothetical protein
MADTFHPSCPEISGAQPYPFLVDPLSHVPTRPRPPLIEQGDHGPYVDHKELHVLYSLWDVLPSRHQRHHDALGWPVCARARRYSNTYSARSTLSFKTPPRVCGRPYPPLESIKGEGKDLSGGGQQATNETHETDASPTSANNISSNTQPSLLTRLGTGSLSYRL